ncbi:MAG: hypothetical protein ACREBU_16400 [Nitrososphaera sp.]
MRDTISSPERDYDNALRALGFSKSEDPFPVSSPEAVDYWADNTDVLKQVVKTEIDSLMFSATTFYLFWGPTGVGKTFATRYISNPQVIQKITKNLKKKETMEPPFSLNVVATAPLRAGDLTLSIHRQLVTGMIEEISKDVKLTEKLAMIHNDIEVGYVKAAFKNLGSAIHRTLHGSVSIENIEGNDGFKYLMQERGKLGRSYDINDLVIIVKYLTVILLSKYGRISITIDELENLSRSRSSTEKVLLSDYLRRLHDVIDSHLRVFLIFSFDSIEEVNVLLQPALLSRITTIIKFDFVNNAKDIKEYISDCIKYRSRTNIRDLFDIEVVDRIATVLLEKFKPTLSFRDINKQMHDVLERCFLSEDRPQKDLRITRRVYDRAMKVDPDSIVKDLKG